MQTKTFHFTPLNLPPRQLRIERRSPLQYDIFDPVRGKWLVLTDEEWVRQNFVAHMVADLGYPSSVIGNEVGLRLNRTLRRADTIVFGRDGSPLLIVEFKAPSVEITQAVFDQIARYNMTLKARFLVVSNGLNHFSCEVDARESTYRFLDHIPTYQEAIAAVFG